MFSLNRQYPANKISFHKFGLEERYFAVRPELHFLFLTQIVHQRHRLCLDGHGIHEQETRQRNTARFVSARRSRILVCFRNDAINSQPADGHGNALKVMMT